MYLPGTAAVMDDRMAAEAEILHVSVIDRGLPVAPAAEPVVPLAIVTGRELPCSSDPDLFFAESPDDVELAKSLCGGCAVRRSCLAGAVERREPWGVWGGELFLRGVIVPRKRARGRPRKDDVAA